MELDLDLLKTEIGVPAFGKRKRIANAIAELKGPLRSPEPEPIAQSESFFHSRSVSSAQGSSFNSRSLLSSPAPPMSTTDSQTLGGFYQNDSPRNTEDANSLLPDTPNSTRPRRESDPGSAQESALNRAGSRNSIIGLGIQLTTKFQVCAV